MSVVFAVTAAILALSAAPAQAAPSATAFTSGSPLVFLSQSDNAKETTLYQATQTAGALKFTDISPDLTVTMPYNAIGYNTQDGYLYGIRSTGVNASDPPELFRIGQAGATVDLGAVTGVGSFATGALNAGDMGSQYGTNTSWAGTYFFRSSDPNDSKKMFYINNVKASRAATLVTLSSAVPNTADLVFLNGYIWAFYGNTSSVATDGTGAGFYRITTSTVNNNWTVTYYPVNLTALHMPLDNYGAQWAYGNGNIGVATNANGAGSTGNTNPVAFQIDITDPTHPKIVATMPTTWSSGNDAASYVGHPIDLGITKTVTPATYTQGGPITYTLTVTNNDTQYDSSGFVVTDVIPATVTNPKSTGSGVTLTGNNLTWVGDALPAGQSVSITITGTAPTTATGTISNTANVIGNEEDDNQANNTSTVTISPAPTTALLTVTKTIVGQFSDMTKQFPFTVTLQDSSGRPVAGSIPSTAGTLPLTAGAAAFTLGNGGKIVLTVPIGDTAVIAETNNYGYDTTYVDSGNSGATSSGPETSALTVTGDREVDFTNEAIYAPPTGLPMDGSGILEMCGIVVFLGVLGYASRLVIIARKRGVN